MNRLLLGTRNRGKIVEIEALLGEIGDLGLLTCDDWPFEDVDETGETFLANALLKAETIATATGLAVLAEDAGLEVLALDGAPGVYSARFSGVPVDYERNNKLLLERLRGVRDRRARFVAVAAVWVPGGEVFVTTGTLSGTIVEEPSGIGGFGYDPLFMPSGSRRTLAEMSLVEKNRTSHRMQAIRRMRTILQELVSQNAAS